MEKEMEDNGLPIIQGMKKGGREEIRRNEQTRQSDRGKWSNKGRAVDREKCHIRRIRELIQRANSLLDRISPAMPGRPPLL